MPLRLANIFTVTILFLLLTALPCTAQIPPRLVKDINIGASAFPVYPFALVGAPVAVGEFLYFQADDGVNGTELWKSDGAEDGTVMVMNINSSGGSNPIQLTYANINGIDTLYFQANDGTNGTELWKSNENGTVMVKDINVSGDSSPYYLTCLADGNGDDILYFRADDGSNGKELWKSDGTAAGTVMLKDINLSSGVGANPSALTVVDNSFYFVANGDSTDWYKSDLWISDGTVNGTVMVKDMNSADPRAGDFPPANLTNVNGTLFFTATDGEWVHDTELWKSDGTAATTVMVKDIWDGTGESLPRNLTNVDGTLYFTAKDQGPAPDYIAHGVELWKSDGTAGNTMMVMDINTSGDSSPALLTNLNGTLYFRASDGTGSALWKIGTGGPEIVSSVSGVGNLIDVGEMLYFQAYDTGNGTELWQSDGTDSGTVMIEDINTGSASAYPKSLTSFGHKLFFVADNGTDGTELMVLLFDNDNDDMPDAWEADNGLDLNVNDASDDLDEDGMSNYEEYLANTDPNDTDTDGDGVVDGFDGWPLDDQQDLCLELIRNGNTLEVFTTIQAAMNVAGNDDIIQVTAGDSEEDIVYTQETVLTLSGGYYCNFSDNTAVSSISSLSIEEGTIIIENIVAQP